MSPTDNSRDWPANVPWAADYDGSKFEPDESPIAHDWPRGHVARGDSAVMQQHLKDRLEDEARLYAAPVASVLGQEF
jgi:hypothetical protein